jgi:hypothetical protein
MQFIPLRTALYIGNVLITERDNIRTVAGSYGADDISLDKNLNNILNAGDAI